MRLVIAFLILAVTGIVANLEEPEGGYIVLYEGLDEFGDFVVIEEFTPYLPYVNFDNRASSYCVQGIFLLYEVYNYNYIAYYFSSRWAWSEKPYCNNVDEIFDNTASSVRYAGDSLDMKKSTINLYALEGFCDYDHSYNSSAETLTLEDSSSSIIVTGCEPWTLYQFENYEGRSTCIYPDSLCRPGFYPLKDDLNDFDGIVSSVRKGCFSDNALYPPIGASGNVTFGYGSFDPELPQGVSD